MEDKKENKTFIMVLIVIIGVCLITIGLTYAYWILTKQQTGENVVNTACLNITFTGENDIGLDKAYPMKPEQLESFLSSATPYHFTIHNECSDLASATINLESLTVSEKALEDQYINAILYEDDYHTNLNRVKKLNASIYNDENKVLEDSLHAYSLYNFNLKPDETRDFNLLLYMDPQTPMVEANMNASWKGKITLSTGYKVDSKALRKISNDTNGMWEYKDILTKIVIEDKKSVKTAEDGGKVYGPFDESEYGTKAVESYVVCDADDTNCVGYLQSDGKVIANSDSSGVFSNFINLGKIDGLENFDTSGVTNMIGMFSGVGNITANFNALNTKKVENMSNMFSGSKIENIDISEFDTSNVINMTSMFSGTNFQTLDLSGWDVTQLKNMSSMFSGMSNLQELNLSNWDLSNYPYPLTAFGGNSSLETINMTNFVFPKDCSNLFNASNGLIALNNIILTDSDTSHVINMSTMFNNNKNLKTLDLSSWDTSNVTNMMAMFSGTNFETLDLSTLNVSHVTNFYAMFDSMNNLTELNLSNWDMSGCLGDINMFSKDPLLETINMTNLVFPQNCEHFFSEISNSLNEIILNNADTSHVKTMSTMFANLKVVSLNLNSFDTSQVTNMNNMFANTTNLQSITFGPKFIHKSDATTSGMFQNCSAPERPSDDSWSEVSF